MAVTKPAAPPSQRKTRTPPRLLEVLRTVEISPHMRRITLGGPAIAGFPADSAGTHIKVFFPRGEQTVPELPTLGPDGPIWPPKPRRPVTRTYSVRRFDAAAGALDIDFVLHGDAGPASSWAERAQPGDRIGIAGPGKPDPFLGPADYYVFAGDMSALPAIGGILESLPESVRGRAFIEIPDLGERQELRCRADIEITWLCREARGVSPLPAALRGMDWPEGEVFAWLAGETSAVLAMRQYLREERALPRSSMYAVPYWKATLDEEAYHEERHRIMDAMEED